MGNVRAAAGTLAPMVGLRVVDLDVTRVDGRAEVYGSQSLDGTSPLAHHRGDGRRFLVALIPAPSLVLRLTLTGRRRLLLFFGVVLVPQTVALEMDNDDEK